MKSLFTKRPTKIAVSSKEYIDEQYVLRGLNMVIPDQLSETLKTTVGKSPYTINSRMFSRDTGEQRVAIRTRKGSTLQFGMESSSETPLAVEHTDTITGELEFSNVIQLASPFVVPSYSVAMGYYSLTNMSFQIRKTSGYIESILVEVWTDSSGAPGSLIATSSLSRVDVTDVSSTVKAQFIDAPDVTSGQSLWVTMKIIGDSTASCFVKVSDTVGGLSRAIGAVTGVWAANSKSIWFEAPSYRSGAVLGAFRRVVSGETNKTLIATGTGPIIAVDNLSNYQVVYNYTPSSYNDYSHRFRFAQEDNRTIFVNGVIQPRYWDGTNVVELTNAPTGASHVFSWKNRLFMIKGNKVSFTDIMTSLSVMETWPSVNYFYPSTPEDPDVITAYAIFQDNLILFTKETKYIVMVPGSGISGLTIRGVIGSKGAQSQEVVSSDNNHVYFVADDNRMYRFNGVSDEPTPVSDAVEPEIRSQNLSSTLSYIHIYDNYVYLYYAKYPSATADRALVYDKVNDEWFMDTGTPVGMSIDYGLEDNRLVRFSSKTTMAMLGEQSYSDMGKPIDFKYWTAYKAYSSGAAEDRIKRWRPILKVGVRRIIIYVGKDINFSNIPDMRTYTVSGGGVTYGDGSTYGQTGVKYGSAKLVDNASPMSRRGKHTQYRIEKNGVDTPVELYGYIARYNTGRNN